MEIRIQKCFRMSQESAHKIINDLGVVNALDLVETILRFLNR